MPSDADKLRQALELYREGDLTRADMLLGTIDFDHLPHELHVEAYYLWGLVSTRRGDPLEAAHCFQTCIKLDQRFFPALDAWGNVLANLGDSRGAIEKYKRALAVASPDQSAHILHNYGQVLLRAGYVLRALRKFRESFQRNGSSQESAYMTGQCFIRLKRPRGALKWMQIAVDLAPKDPLAQLGLGNALLAADKHVAAQAHYKRALELDPACGDAHYNWAVSLAQQGEYAKAVRHCKQGLRTNRDGFELLAQQAYCLRMMGAYDAALQTATRMRQVIEHVSSDRKPEFLDVLVANEAASLRALGRGQQARGRLVTLLRESREACNQSLAELRYHDTRRLNEARRYELTLNVRMARPMFQAEEVNTPGNYRRTYWVIAESITAARRIVRELEPPEAELRFDPDVQSSEKLADVDRGVIERSAAVAED
jgi:tetratricopeptide (TPR) repeat protein